MGFFFIVIVNNGLSDGIREWFFLLSESGIMIFNFKDNFGGVGGFKVGS